MGTGNVPEGWYPDPADGAGERWWDGQQWTGATRRAAAAPAGPRRRLLAVGALVAVLAVGTVALVAFLGDDDGDPAAPSGAGETDPLDASGFDRAPPGPEPEADPAPDDPPRDIEEDAAPAPELPGTADAALHEPTPWITFGELPGNWRYEDFFTDPVELDIADEGTYVWLSGDDDEQGSISVWAYRRDELLDELEVANFEEYVALVAEEDGRVLARIEGPLPFGFRGGFPGVQFWGELPEDLGGTHSSSILVDLDDHIMFAYLAYNGGAPGLDGQPTRDEVDAWMRTIRIDTTELRGVLPAG